MAKNTCEPMGLVTTVKRPWYNRLWRAFVEIFRGPPGPTGPQGPMPFSASQIDAWIARGVNKGVREEFARWKANHACPVCKTLEPEQGPGADALDLLARELTATELDELRKPDPFAGRKAATGPKKLFIEPKAAFTLPTDSEARKQVPIFRGCLRYFPAALAGISKVSKAGNDKHNPGEELHHARGKSTDHGDCVLRHLIDIQDLLRVQEPLGDTGAPGQLLDEVNQFAWRALAYSQELHEKFGGAPLAPGAKKG